MLVSTNKRIVVQAAWADHISKITNGKRALAE
jgi:hypothetical protein